MKGLVMCLTMVGCLFLSVSTSSAFYIEVDNFSMHTTGSFYEKVTDNTRYLRQDFTVTNSGDTLLNDVGVLWTFMSSGNLAFYYNTTTGTWERSVSGDGIDPVDHWLKVYTDNPVTSSDPVDYFSMDRDNTNVDLEGISGDGRLLSLSETDSVPVFWLGDLDAGESATFSWFAEQGPYISPITQSTWNFDIQSAVVADMTPVPLLGSLWLLGSGLLAFGIARKKAAKK